MEAFLGIPYRVWHTFHFKTQALMQSFERVVKKLFKYLYLDLDEERRSDDVFLYLGDKCIAWHVYWSFSGNLVTNLSP